MDWEFIMVMSFLYLCMSAIMYLILIQMDNNPILVLFCTLFWPLAMAYMVLYFSVLKPVKDCIKYIKERKGK